MIILSLVNFKLWLVIFESNTDIILFVYHESRALHKVIHDALKLWHVLLIILFKVIEIH